jgi:hypothetical protein
MKGSVSIESWVMHGSVIHDSTTDRLRIGGPSPGQLGPCGGLSGRGQATVTAPGAAEAAAVVNPGQSHGHGYGPSRAVISRPATSPRIFPQGDRTTNSSRFSVSKNSPAEWVRKVWKYYLQHRKIEVIRSCKSFCK